MLRSGRPRHWSRWLYRFQWLFLTLIALTVVAVRVGLLHLDSSFRVFTGLGLAMVALALLSMLVFLWGMVRRHSEARTAALWAMLMGVIPVALPLFFVGQQNLSAPALYDISTDLKDPPQFDLLLSLRKEGDHSPDYPGSAAAVVQEKSPLYGDIKPLILTATPSEVISQAELVARDLGWRIIAVQAGKGQLEAVVRTPILGITQDVVVRIRPVDAQGNQEETPERKSADRANSTGADAATAPEPTSTRVDMRSASRTGSRDLGSNAESIRTFLQKLKQRVSERGEVAQ
ncbi:DUF1499 domain-containing protein [Microbulbifer elongatus]|uniref:DUF1499 domain-containing protein n=1 Tax=Microbulbifer elongatus TaxID=86173 RepID=UPI001E31DC34|nr:DUF1499 domain-containing protein [Microbulbifer elongatus]